MAYHIEVSLMAENDVDEAMVYYEDQRAKLGTAFLAEFLAFSDLISEHPTHFTKKISPYRRALMKKFPYAIHFEVNDQKQEVIILAVWHVKRDPKALKERLI